MKMLTDKFVVVTGATRGIGEAVARICAREGAGIGLNYRSGEDNARHVADELRRQYQVPVKHLCFDVRDKPGIDRALSSLLAEGIKIDAWVNNAAINLPGLLVTVTDEMIQEQIYTNILGPIHCCRAVLPHMMENRQGAIVNIGSITSEFVSQGQAIYATTKGAIVSLTKSLAKEYGRKGIRVNCVEPGPIDTDMLKLTKMLLGDEIKQRIPLQRLGNCNDVAELVAYLLSDRAAFITGGIYNIDGGYTLG
jgi:3-oxoacyl-[acyl-carrier protein] reductase